MLHFSLWFVSLHQGPRGMLKDECWWTLIVANGVNNIVWPSHHRIYRDGWRTSFIHPDPFTSYSSKSTKHKQIKEYCLFLWIMLCPWRSASVIWSMSRESHHPSCVASAFHAAGNERSLQRLARQHRLSTPPPKKNKKTPLKGVLGCFSLKLKLE